MAVRPFFNGMNEHGTSSITKSTNISFCNAILHMGIDTTVCDFLVTQVHLINAFMAPGW